MRLLIVYHSFPEPDTNAGGLRLFEIVKMLRRDGHDITFLAAYRDEARYRRMTEDLGVACLSDEGGRLSRSCAGFAGALQAGAFDAAIFVHYMAYEGYAQYLRAFLPDCHLILDTVDIHHLRLEREAELYPEKRDAAERTKRAELSAVVDADSIWVVTEKEQRFLEPFVAHKKTPFHIVPTLHPVSPVLPPYEQREGVVFIGSYQHQPNVDAVRYFMESIYPLLNAALPGVRVTLAGSDPPEDFRRYAERYANVCVTGFVEDHRELLTEHRVGIAPLRFGAGMKGKIGDYLACGLPCVSSSIGAEGMGLMSDAEVLVADDPRQFAEQVIRLHGDASAWQRMSQAGLDFVARRLTPEANAAAVREALRDAAANPARARHNRPLRAPRPRRAARFCRRSLGALRVGGVPELNCRLRLWRVCSLENNL